MNRSAKLIVLLSILLSVSALPSRAYIAVGGERLTLPEVMMEFRCIAMAEVERVDAARGMVRYGIVEELLGKWQDKASLKHSVALDGKPQLPMKAGDRAVLFWGSFDPRSLVLTEHGWYQTRSPQAGDDGWERLTQLRPDLQTVFAESPRRLDEVIRLLRRGEDVTTLIRPKAGPDGDRLPIRYSWLDPHRRFTGKDEGVGTPKSKAVGDWIADLSSPKPLVRQQASRVLRETGGDGRGAVAAMAAALDDSGVEVRCALLEALEHLAANEGNIVPKLTKLLKDEERFVASGAARALASRGAAAKPALEELGLALADRNFDHDFRPFRAAEAARAILIIAPDSRQAKDALRLLTGERMLRDFRPDGYGTRAAAARMLGDAQAGAGPALPALAERLEDELDSVRVAAAQAILRIDPASIYSARARDILLKALDARESIDRIRAIQAIVSVQQHLPWARAALSKAENDADPAVRAFLRRVR